jgi:hypothetical protein
MQCWRKHSSARKIADEKSGLDCVRNVENKVSFLTKEFVERNKTKFRSFVHNPHRIYHFHVLYFFHNSFPQTLYLSCPKILLQGGDKVRHNEELPRRIFFRLKVSYLLL